MLKTQAVIGFSRQDLHIAEPYSDQQTEGVLSMSTKSKKQLGAICEQQMKEAETEQ